MGDSEPQQKNYGEQEAWDEDGQVTEDDTDEEGKNDDIILECAKNQKFGQNSKDSITNRKYVGNTGGLSKYGNISNDFVNTTESGQHPKHPITNTKHVGNTGSISKPSIISNDKKEINNQNRKYFLIAVPIMIVFTIISIFVPTDFISSNFSFILYNQRKIITIEEIATKFPHQPIETLKTIEAVIDDVLKYEPIHPAVFLFIFDKNTENNEFVSEIANFASSKLQVAEDHIILDETIYSKPKILRDYGYLISDYKPELESKKVMLVKNLHKMPGKTAQALHSFCDEIEPLVDRAVYILTLKVDSYSGNEMHTAEKQLYNVWNDLKMDILAPLVTRVTSTVIKIH